MFKSLAVDRIQVQHACHTTASKCGHVTLSVLESLDEGAGVLVDGRSQVVRCAPKKLGLVADPVQLWSAFTVIFSHQNTSGAFPTDLDKVGGFGISPIETQLPRLKLGTVAEVATKEATSELAVTIRLDDSHSGSCPLLQFFFKTLGAFEMKR